MLTVGPRLVVKDLPCIDESGNDSHMCHEPHIHKCCDGIPLKLNNPGPIFSIRPIQKIIEFVVFFFLLLFFWY